MSDNPDGGTGTDDVDLSGVEDFDALPPEAFAVPPEEPEQEPEPEPEPEEGPKPEEPPADEPPAEPEAKPDEQPPDEGATDEPPKEEEPPAEDEPPAEEPQGFDAGAWAEERGLDGALFKSCKSHEDALNTLAISHVNLQQLHGRHTQEVGESRQTISDLQRRLEAVEKGELPDSKLDEPPETAEPQPLTPEQRQAFLEEFDREPEKAIQGLLKDRLPQSAPVDEAALVERVRAQIEWDRANEEAERSWAEFQKAHPDWQERQEVMRGVVADIDWRDAEGNLLTPPYEDLYELAGDKVSDPQGYSDAVARIKRNWSMDEVREFRSLKKAQAQAEAGATDRARATVKKASTAAAPQSRTQPPASAKTEETEFDNLPSEYFAA
jgi:hypothetical protein